jgi:hypothetical protein
LIFWLGEDDAPDKLSSRVAHELVVRGVLLFAAVAGDVGL